MNCITHENLYSPLVKEESEEEDDTFHELFTCKYCEYQTPNIDTLDEHIVSHDEAIFEDSLPENTVLSAVHCPESYLLNHNNHKEKLKSSKKPADYSVMSYQKSVGINHKKAEYGAEKTKSVCPYCRYKSGNKLDMDRHLKKHCEPVEVAVFACSECSYTTFRKSDMTKHLLIHVKDERGPKYECNHCSYKTIKKWCLQKHMLCHKKPDEVEMYSCSQCTYSTKRRSDLRKHLFTHENHPNILEDGNSNSLIIYKCSHCPYESIKKWCLQKHMFRHKKPEEIEMFFCDQCTFFTNRRSSVKKHQVIHTKKL